MVKLEKELLETELKVIESWASLEEAYKANTIATEKLNQVDKKPSNGWVFFVVLFFLIVLLVV